MHTVQLNLPARRWTSLSEFACGVIVAEVPSLPTQNQSARAGGRAPHQLLDELNERLNRDVVAHGGKRSVKKATAVMVMYVPITAELLNAPDSWVLHGYVLGAVARAVRTKVGSTYGQPVEVRDAFMEWTQGEIAIVIEVSAPVPSIPAELRDPAWRLS